MFYLGDLQACCDHVDAGVQRYHEDEHRAHASLFGGHDAAVCGCGQAALARWLLGYPEEARAEADRALAHAHALGHAPSIVHAMDYELMLLLFERDPATVQQAAKRFIDYADEQDFRDYRARGVAARGWALIHLDQRDIGLTLLRGGIETQRFVGTAEDLTVYLELLAEGHAVCGETDLAMQTIDEAIGMAEEGNMLHWLPALFHRKAAELGCDFLPTDIFCVISRK